MCRNREADDPLSLDRVKNIFLENPGAQSDPFRFLVQRLTGKTFRGRDARDRWQNILAHKADMQANSGRRVTIGVAASRLLRRDRTRWNPDA